MYLPKAPGAVAHRAAWSDLVTGEMIVHPTETCAASQEAEHGYSGCECGAEGDVAHLPNSFIMYRQERHCQIVKEDPSMHNTKFDYQAIFRSGFLFV